MMLDHARYGFDQNVRTFLMSHAADKQDGGVCWPDGVLPFYRGGLDPSIEIANVNTVINDRNLPFRDFVHPLNFSLERARHRNDAVGTLCSGTLLGAHPLGLPVAEPVAA